MAGLDVTKDQVNQAVGSAARELNLLLARVQQLQSYMAATPDANLTALGFAQAEVDNLKGAVAAMDQLRQIFEGTQAKAQATDMRAFPKRIWGLGGP